MACRAGSCMGSHTGVWAHLLLYSCSFLSLCSFALDPAELQRQLDQVANAQARAPPGVAPFDVSKVEVRTPGVMPISAPQPIPVSAQQVRSRVEAAAEQFQAPANPVLQLYVQETKQYLKDASEAEKAAEMYAKMSQELIDKGALKATTQSLTRGEMSRVGARLWAHNVYVFEKMLMDKSGSVGMAAAAKGGIPYQKMVDAYTKQQGVYDVAAQGYALRVSEILPVSKKLMTYANQYRLQGNDKMADDYDNQASSLMKQAEAFASEAKKDYAMATELNVAVPGIQKMVGIAGEKARYLAMKGAPMPIPQSHLFPFTPVPPLEFVQVGESVQHQTVRSSTEEGVEEEEKALAGAVAAAFPQEVAAFPPPTPPQKFLQR